VKISFRLRGFDNHEQIADLNSFSAFAAMDEMSPDVGAAT
jgi:hypothetical protein